MDLRLLSYAKALFLVLIASMSAVTLAKILVVGDDQGWRYGYDYVNWTIHNHPFYLNDVLVFKYGLPNTIPFPHDVFLLTSYRSFLECDFRGAKQLAGPTEGSGEGFKFVLNQWRPYFFACSTRNGIHCRNGTMRFFVFPLRRCRG